MKLAFEYRLYAARATDIPFSNFQDQTTILPRAPGFKTASHVGTDCLTAHPRTRGTDENYNACEDGSGAKETGSSNCARVQCSG